MYRYRCFYSLTKPQTAEDTVVYLTDKSQMTSVPMRLVFDVSLESLCSTVYWRARGLIVVSNVSSDGPDARLPCAVSNQTISRFCSIICAELSWKNSAFTCLVWSIDVRTNARGMHVATACTIAFRTMKHSQIVVNSTMVQHQKLPTLYILSSLASLAGLLTFTCLTGSCAIPPHLVFTVPIK